MAYYHYLVKNNMIISHKGEISEIFKGFHYHEHKSFGESEIHYKSENGVVVEVISETELGQAYARKEVEEFLENL